MTNGRIELRLAEQGIELPVPAASVANFVPCVLSGTTLYIAGQVPLRSGVMTHPGQVGVEVTVEQAKEGARICALNALSQARAFLGTLDRITRICMVQGFVNAVHGFGDHPVVMNGVSDLLVEVFGEHVGRHARFAVGVPSLPFNAAVEVAMIVEVSP